jgi:disulfide bond formation protein DsbB|tara:strand:+ start:268 stop:687 length:420 start_codon:yes stop_codon:yes gene_type:complete
MKKIIILVTLIVLAISCGNTENSENNSNQVSSETSEVSKESKKEVVKSAGEGKEIYQKSCSACHGSEATGVDGLGKDLVKGAFIKSLADDELITFIKEGRDTGSPDNSTGIDMPPNGGNPALKDEDIKAIILYLRSIQE